MILFVVSGLIYVAGAIGFELLGAWEADFHGTDTIRYCILFTCEEFLEMIGIVLLIYSLLSYIVHEIGYPTVTFEIKASD